MKSVEVQLPLLLVKLRERLPTWGTAATEASHGLSRELHAGPLGRAELCCADGAVSIGNNVSEREMKPVVLNRKNSCSLAMRAEAAPRRSWPA